MRRWIAAIGTAPLILGWRCWSRSGKGFRSSFPLILPAPLLYPPPLPLTCCLLCTTSSFIADRDHVIPAHACALGARFEGIKFSAFLFAIRDGAGAGYLATENLELATGNWELGTGTGTGTLWQMVVRLQGIPLAGDRPTQPRKKERYGTVWYGN